MFSFISKLKTKANFSKLKDKNFKFLFDEDKSGELVVVDTETTGLNTKKDEILSIGAVKIKDNKILTSQTFEVFLKNSKEIDSSSIKIHGIRPFDLKNAKTTKEGILEFLNFVGSRPLVGYYLEFDVDMINKYTKEILGITLPNRMIEVSEIYFDKSISLIPQGNIDLRFDTILKNCDIPNMGTHNAVNDAIMTAMIYLKLTKER
ncbi:3'-5' exonuclease [Sulfurimonas sp. CVO]|mgnify:CR=1 FL=1|jgi:DNA polymerase-3 subunit epsilon|uniref:3'-5' exonuclease n=1 Tax=Sulfurimonas xiamenensis TaxID=2590021 RepID=A0AAJ4DN23_9BACT|nr:MULTISPECIES: 3'-5' exonuclease [Sulfurimonas]PLY11914.1 MAG: DNA polymerase III subunit epsilon [Sulfurimonas sp.]QFR43626.1 3'-5' exonuclease [Sulfurimonas xiamenensis]QHG90823.1 3'-5' exonuclease [Sulfurimonas sp. CVO]